jgi:lipoprotein signal peptidase
MPKVKFSLTLITALFFEQLVTFWVVRAHSEWINSSDRFIRIVPAWLSGLLCLGLLFVLQKYYLKGKRYESPLGLLAAGLLGNLLSVALYGKFIDFIPWGLSYANLADLYIVVGGLLIVMYYRMGSGDPDQ